MKYCQAKRTRRGREVAVVFGDSHDDLPFAREEARLVAERFKTHAIVGRQATKSCLMGEIRALGAQLDVVHLACHGHFDPVHPLESGIMLAADGDAPPSLTVQEIFGLELDVDLVVLSACDTGVNDRRPGDELIGLTRALIYTGARSVLVSLWPADDVSTLVLMDDFYRQLSLGSSKAEALRHAQCHVLGLEEEETRAYVSARVEHLKRSGHAARAKRLEQLARDSLVEAEEFNPRPLHGQPWHPYSGAAWWAPFILVGDWR
jgi:CHAT domain-containing protein